ncbi:hypothetical protein [Bosea beijingensis]
MTITATHLPSDMDGGTIRDIELAKALGYTRPGNIRNLIRRHLPALESIGPLLSSPANPVGTEYRLTTAQAAFVLAKAGTTRADGYLATICEIFAVAAVLGRRVRLGTAQPFQREPEVGRARSATHAAASPSNPAVCSPRLERTTSQ